MDTLKINNTLSTSNAWSLPVSQYIYKTLEKNWIIVLVRSKLARPALRHLILYDFSQTNQIDVVTCLHVYTQLD